MKKLKIQSILSGKSKTIEIEGKKSEPAIQVNVNNHFLNLYEQILENSNDVHYCINFENLFFEYLSPSIKTLIGVEREEFLSSPINQIVKYIHPDDQEMFVEHFKKLKKDRIRLNLSITYRLKPPMGIYRWVTDKHKLLFDPIIGNEKIIGSLNDVTDQILAENALKRSRDRMYMAIEATNDGMWDWKLTTNELYFDERFYSMLGYEPYEFPALYQEWIKRIHPEDIKSVQSQLEKHLQGKSPNWTIEYRFKSKDNNWVWILNRGKVFERDEDDTPLRMVGTHSDITFRKKAELSLKDKNNELLNTEKKLKESNSELQRLNSELLNKNNEFKQVYEQLQINEEQFRQLAENTQDIYLLCDKNGILYISPAFEKIWGRSREEVYKNPTILLKWVYPEDRSNFTSWDNIFNLNLTDFHEEQYRIIKPSGEITWIWSRLFPIIDNNNTIYRITGISTDISQLKKFEFELIEAKEKAQESDRLKSAFLANISHEIRTPMNGIIGFASLLKEKIVSREKQNQYIDIITQSSVSLLRIIEDLVDISKIEANQLQISRSDVNINKIINHLHEHFSIEKQLYGKNNIEFRKEINTKIPDPIVSTDENRLTQILNNLVSNAFKFTESGQIVIGYELTNTTEIIFFVKDTGIGISDNAKPHIFKRFRQQETALSRKFGGTGLGLSICEGLVKLLDGRIWFESETNVGTTFYVSLPLIKQKGSTPELNEENSNVESYYWPDKIILLVEDDPINQEYFKTILKPTGANVLLSISGEDAINLVTNISQIDLILLDIRLPNMSGYEAFKKIKKISPHIPIIAQTAYAMPEDYKICMDMGFADFITKPVYRNLLLSKLNVFLSKKI